MRHPPLLLICALSIATGIVTGLLTNQGLPVSGRQPAMAAIDVSVVDRFYDEVNATLSGGNGSGFETLLTAGFVHRTSYQSDVLGPGAFRQSLVELRSVYPDLHLTATGINVVQDTVLVQVQVTGNESTELVGFATGRHDAWSSFDQFRIEQGRIAERWSPSKNVSIEWARQEALTIPAPAMRRFGLSRMTLTLNQERTTVFDDPALLIGDIGQFSVTMRSSCEGLPALPNPTVDGRVKAPTESTSLLSSGDVIVIPAKTCITITNLGADPTDLLVVSATLSPSPGDLWPIKGQVASSAALQATLAGGLAAILPVGASIISVGRLALAPNVSLPAQITTGPQLIFVKSGTLGITLPNDRAWAQDRPSGMARMISEGSLRAGSGLLVPTGTKVTYRAESDEPVRMFVVTLEQTSE